MADPEPFKSEEDNLSALDRELYERNRPPQHLARPTLKPRQTEVGPGWTVRTSTAVVRPPRAKWFSLSILSKLFIAAAAFFVLALAVAGWLLFRGSNIVSNSNIDIDLTGPLTVKSGGDFDLGIAVTNKNRTDLETADLIVEFPAGTRDPLDVKKDLTKLRQALGIIDSGQTKIQGVQAILFGQEKAKLPIEVTLEYRLKGSDAIFEKAVTYEVQIADSPISVNVDLPESVNAGRDIELGLEVVTNSPTVLKDVALAIIWPPGFTPTQTSIQPAASGNTTIWQLGDLSPGGKRSLKVVGQLTGQDSELKSFRIQVGLLASATADELSVLYTDVLKTVLVERPFVGLAMSVNDDTSDTPIANWGELSRVLIDWGNNLAVAVGNGTITLRLSGSALRESSVTTPVGTYSSIDDQIVWDQVSVPALANLAPGDRGNLQASFASILFSDQSAIRNPAIDLVLTFRGERQESGRQGEIVETVVKKTLKLAANFQGWGAAFYYNGPFANTGPLPPKVDTPTTFTISWQLSTGGNDVKGAQMFATVPRGVRWLGQVTPATEKLVYDDLNRTLTWQAGYLPAGSRGETKAREIAFQVELIPSANQINQTPNLLENIQAVAVDTFTGQAINRSLGALTTKLSTDANFSASNGNVVP